jgi:ABC-type transport system involved in cytochrome bd biosynthesis fused ATPase/permease subunit
MDVLRTAFQTSLVLEWGTTAATALVAIEVSFRLLHGLLPFERALAVLLLTPEFFQPLRQLALRYHAGSAGKAGAEALYALLDTPAPPAPARRGLRAPPERLDVRFEDVHLAYDGGRRPGPSGIDSPAPHRRSALAGLSLTLAHGETTALLGSTGAGKSTVAGLLLRFLEPDRGAITVGGVPLREIDPVRWRAQVAWVPQHPHFFPGTVAENLRLARPGASQAALLAAAREAQAHEFIARLPRGYDTPLGERGARLSGGQAQRLAIARALLKDAPLLLLDEPTSQLDAAREARIGDALLCLRPRRTVLLITHRPALAATAGAVVHIERGHVVRVVCNAGRAQAPREAVLRELEPVAGGGGR